MGEWYTPIQYQEFRQSLWKKLEKNSQDVPEKMNKRMTYFNNHKKLNQPNAYDLWFNPPQGYNQRMHRCDRFPISVRHENIFEEERDKVIPVLASLRYGRPCLEQLEFNDGQHKMKDNLNDFCRRFGLSISPDLEPKCEMITINKCNI